MRSDAGETEFFPIAGLGPPSSICQRQKRNFWHEPEVWIAEEPSSLILERTGKIKNGNSVRAFVCGPVKQRQGAAKSAYL